MRRYYLIPLALLVCFLIGNCGGGGPAAPTDTGTTGNDTIQAGPPEGETMAEAGDFSLKVLSSSYEFGGSADYRLEVSEEPGGVEVAVLATATDLRAVMLHLDYDPATFCPKSGSGPDWPGLSADDSLSLLKLDRPGAVHYGRTVVRPQDSAGVSGEFEVLRVRFDSGAEVSRTVAAVPTSWDSAIPNLTVDFATGNISFHYYNIGDYNQDSLVGVSDLTPIGVYYDERSDPPGGFPEESVLSVVDGNHNGLIEVGDITPIGQNYENRVTLWRVYGGPATDYPGDYDEEEGNGAATIYGTVGFVDTVSLPYEERLRFASNIASLAAFTDEAVWMRPVGTEDDEGVASNMVLAGVDVTPPVWTDTVGVVSAVPGIGEATVSWGEATDSESPPVEYRIYYDDSAEPFQGEELEEIVAAPALSTVIGGLTDGVEYSFMVRAADSADTPNEDDNDVVLTATPGTDMTPPVWTYEPDGIVEVVPLDGGARVTWGEATDADSGPVTYIVYYNEGTTVDFETASSVEIPALAPPDPEDNSDRMTEITGLTNDTEYAFAVHARDSAPALNEDKNTNIATITPLATEEVPAMLTGATTFDGPMTISAPNTVTVTGGQWITFMGDLTIADGATLLGNGDDLLVEVHGNFYCDGLVDLQLPTELPADSDCGSMQLVLMGDVTFDTNSQVNGNGNIYLVDDPEELLTPEEVETETDNDTNPDDYPFNWMPEDTPTASKAPVSLKTTSRVVYYGPRPWRRWIVRGNWGRIRAQPRNVRRVVLRCAPVNGELHFEDFSIEGPPGQDGADKSGGCTVIGNDGEDNRFRLRMHCGRTMTFNNVNIKLGDGGNGGDATTDLDCKPGYAEGGDGGEPLNKFRFTAGAGGGIHVVGNFNFNPGNGGDGGMGTAYGADGEDGCPAEDGWNATGIGGEGGDVPRWGARTRGNVTGMGNLTMGIAEGGMGGIGLSNAGDGGNDTCCPGQTGGAGGEAVSTGGIGGDAVFSGGPTGSGGGGATGGEGGLAEAWAGSGGNGADCGKEPGGNGGAGGAAVATGGDGGEATGTGTLTQGSQGQALAYGGDGGYGGDGWGPGTGGAGGTATADGDPATETPGDNGDDGIVTPAVFSQHQIPPPPTSVVPGPFPDGDYIQPIYDKLAGGALVGSIAVNYDTSLGGFMEVYETAGGIYALRILGGATITWDKNETIDYEGIDNIWIGIDLTTEIALGEMGGTMYLQFYNDGILLGEQPITPNMSGEDTTEQFLIEPGTEWDVCVLVTPPDAVLDLTEIVVIDP